MIPNTNPMTIPQIRNPKGIRCSLIPAFYPEGGGGGNGERIRGRNWRSDLSHSAISHTQRRRHSLGYIRLGVQLVIYPRVSASSAVPVFPFTQTHNWRRAK